jgi:hypothetical protein
VMTTLCWPSLNFFFSGDVHCFAAIWRGTRSSSA